MSEQPRILNNRYQLERKLGQGGMATVYLGRDLRLNRPVAIKVLHGQYASDEQFLRRFKHEADAAAQLGHPNIVRVYDIGAEGDFHYIVMEYVQGTDLKEIIELQAPLPVPRTLAIVRQIAEALQAAHDSGLVHRDVKPQNVLIDSNDYARLSDFGIAKSKQSSALTDPGTTFGTADYLAPEQAQGLGATPLSDVYALGVLTYEMLTGRLPFSGDSPLAVALQHIQATPPALRNYNPSIPPQLEAIVLQAMAKDPAQRPQSARAFAELLRLYRERGNQATMAVPSANVGRVPAAQEPADVRPPRQQPAPQARPRQNYAPPLAAQQPVPMNPSTEKRQSSGCGLWVVAILLLVGIGALAYVLMFTNVMDSITQAFGGKQATQVVPTGEPTPAPEMVEVPPLVGKSESEVLELLKSLELGEQRKAPRNDLAPAATVIEQDIAPGTKVAKGTVIPFTLSLGPAQVEIDDVTRQQFEVASDTLTRAGFKVIRKDAPNQTIPAGFVLSQNPPAGLKLAQGSEIELVVSIGDMVTFPNIIGIKRADAEAILAARSDLRLDIVDEQGPDLIPNFDSVEPNTVVSATANGQPVENGNFIPRNSVIVIGVRRP
ncbi:Stk1 family PASTA domain-containing Ser/Thr kinase [Herpetosiphon giganteus]|uniref:Stk1 family PASTA domain-containing Ser/Thr kinase n=1 Tax=Herpetosiphon giganteus TaxID=2029754 RepID=UPI00195A276B|nr:Stk1 family PASTA domain-containing Ser/Thr kinase [Herpetosiphon giganteus]MBM7842966.1 serine/threonine-protein kinase [Herpetosiphon giganteus]